MIIAKWNPTLNKYDYIGGLTEIVKKYVNDIAATRLGKAETAVNSDKVGNKTISQIMTLGMSYADRTKITDGNLNDYKTEGKFVVPDADAAARITNSAFTNTGYFLDVIYRTTTMSIQIAMSWEGLIKIRYSSNVGLYREWQFINDGGNSATVNGHTVKSDVPENFTPYTHPTYVERAGVPSANQTPAFGDTFSISQPVSDKSGHIKEINERTVKIPSTHASAAEAGLVNTMAQVFSGNKTFNGQILPEGASDCGTPQARKLASGTDAANNSNCPPGAWYGRHD